MNESIEIKKSNFLFIFKREEFVEILNCDVFKKMMEKANFNVFGKVFQNLDILESP